MLWLSGESRDVDVFVSLGLGIGAGIPSPDNAPEGKKDEIEGKLM
jgi:hypothetical protein